MRGRSAGRSSHHHEQQPQGESFGKEHKPQGVGKLKAVSKAVSKLARSGGSKGRCLPYPLATLVTTWTPTPTTTTPKTATAPKTPPAPGTIPTLAKQYPHPRVDDPARSGAATTSSRRTSQFHYYFYHFTPHFDNSQYSSLLFDMIISSSVDVVMISNHYPQECLISSFFFIMI